VKTCRKGHTYTVSNCPTCSRARQRQAYADPVKRANRLARRRANWSTGHGKTEIELIVQEEHLRRVAARQLRVANLRRLHPDWSAAEIASQFDGVSEQMVHRDLERLGLPTAAVREPPIDYKEINFAAQEAMRRTRQVLEGRVRRFSPEERAAYERELRSAGRARAAAA
jgi:hypothetical protein